MGNRAQIMFGEKEGEMEPGARHIGVYLHWNGGPESIYAFVKTLASYLLSQKEGGKGWVGYEQIAARFIQLTTNYSSAVSSDFLNIAMEANPGKPLTNREATNNGVFVIHPDFSISRVGNGKVDEKGRARYWTDTDRIEEFKAVMRHEYWEKSSECSGILEDIRVSNDGAFLKKYSSSGSKRSKYKFLQATLPIEKEFNLCAELALIEGERIAAAIATPEPTQESRVAMRL